MIKKYCYKLLDKIKYKTSPRLTAPLSLVRRGERVRRGEGGEVFAVTNHPDLGASHFFEQYPRRVSLHKPSLPSQAEIFLACVGRLGSYSPRLQPVGI